MGSKNTAAKQAPEKAEGVSVLPVNVQVASVQDLRPDDKNMNKGSEFGNKLMGDSFQKFGAGRSVLVDKNNRLIAGNKSFEKFGEVGGQKVLIVDADKDTLVAVRRSDLDLDTPEGREFALADNATAKANIVWAEEAVAEVVGVQAAQAWGVYVAPVQFDAPGGAGNDLPETPGSGGGRRTPGISDDEYSAFEVIMRHENKLRLVETIDAVRIKYDLPSIEAAMMHILDVYLKTAE